MKFIGYRVIDTVNEAILLLSRTWIWQLPAQLTLHMHMLSLARSHQKLWEHRRTVGSPAVRMT